LARAGPGYRHGVADPLESDGEVLGLERRAQRLLDDGAGSRELALALDQLRADRTNGESLGSATDDLRRILERFGGTDQENVT
jgi:hypothetical protein